MAEKNKSDDKPIEQIAQLSLAQLIKLKFCISCNSNKTLEFIFGHSLAAINLILLTIFSFGIASLVSTLIVGLVMGESIPEIFDVWLNMWVSAWDNLRNILDEFVYDIIDVEIIEHTFSV
jgi:hypothetical protein